MEIIILLFIAAGAYFYWHKPRQEKKHMNTLEYFEELAANSAKRLFEMPHFLSVNIVDYQDKHDVMEINYLRLKQRFLEDDEKRLVIAKHWAKYVEALNSIKHSTEMFHYGIDDDPRNSFSNDKESYIIIDEVEKKFKALLGKDFHKLPLSYGERKEKLGVKDDFLSDRKERALYFDSRNYVRMLEQFGNKKKKEETTN